MNTKEILQGIKDWAAPKVIYDISAAHNNTKYTDLSDALGTNGDNIPQEYRKGGITVRYVQSSDNKYVQYRLMADEWSTIAANWQGVDNMPVADSNNLVQSGGVYENFRQVYSKINGVLGDYFIDYNHIISYSSTVPPHYVFNNRFDSAWVCILKGTTKLTLSGATPTRYFFFSSFDIDDFPTTEVGHNTTGTVPNGDVVVAIITFSHTNNPDGYDNLVITQDNPFVQQKEMDSVSEISNNAYKGYYLDKNHLFSTNADSINYISDDNFDNIQLSISNPLVKKLVVGNVTPTRFIFFSSEGIDAANYIGRNADGTVLDGAKWCSITIRHSDLPEDGYKNVYVSQVLSVPSSTNKLLKITKNGTNIALRTKLNDTNDLVVTMHQDSKGYDMTFEAFYIGSNTLDDYELITDTYLIRTIGDMVGAIGISSFWYLYAQHGWSIPRFTPNSLSVDDSDVGSVWKDQNDRQFVIGKVDSTYVYLLPVISQNSGTGIYTASWNGNMEYPTTLTHVSGGAHTATITGTSSRYDLRVQTAQNRKFYADGVEVVDNGTYFCDEFVVKENIIGYNVGKVNQWFPTPVYNGSLIDWDRSFIFVGASCTCNTTMNVKYPFIVSDFRGCIPQMPLANGDYHSYTLIPKIKKLVNSHRVDIPFNSDNGTIDSDYVSVVRNSTDLYNVDDQPERCICYLKDNSNNYLVGMAGGYSLVRGMTVASKRNEYVPIDTNTCTYGGASTLNKFYPKTLQNAGFEGGVIGTDFIDELSCYFCWFNPSVNNGQVYWYKDGDSYILYCHCQTSQSKLAINLPDFMEGMVVGSTIEKTDGATLLTTQVVSGRLYVSYDTTDNAANYIVVRLK